MLEFTSGIEKLSVSERDKAFVAQQLGREPRGLEAVQLRRATGDPAVIRVASLVDGKPFPTLFWLVDPQLHYQLSQLEAAGTIADLQRKVDQSAELQASMLQDNQRYIALREQLMSTPIRLQLERAGFLASLQGKGIGGLGSFDRIRCLHTWYAAHLVEPNTVGCLLQAGANVKPRPAKAVK